MSQAHVAGEPRLDGARAALKALGVPDAERLAVIDAERKQKRLEELIQAGSVTAFPDALRLVQAVAALGWPMAVVSSSKNANQMMRPIHLESGQSLFDVFSVIKKAVLTALGWERSINSSHIGVVAKSGVVTIMGQVESLAQKEAAEATASRVWGVEAVIEQLTVGPPPKAELSDDEIAAAVIDRLAKGVSVLRDSIHVRVEKGWITLTGEVDSNYHRLTLDQEVRRLHGVAGLSNQVIVKPGVNVSNVAEK